MEVMPKARQAELAEIVKPLLKDTPGASVLIVFFDGTGHVRFAAATAFEPARLALWQAFKGNALPSLQGLWGRGAWLLSREGVVTFVSTDNPNGVAEDHCPGYVLSHLKKVAKRIPTPEKIDA